MTGAGPHLTEADRQMLADGSVPPRRRRKLDAHLEACASCAADVARLERVDARFAGEPSAGPDQSLRALWPEIRSRIEQGKTVPLTGGAADSPRALPRVWTFQARWAARAAGFAAAVVAAVLLIVALARRHQREPVAPVASAPAPVSPPRLVALEDSTQSYQEEARALLDRLELQRALLRPEAKASIDRDLRLIDQAIAELEAAIAADPNNPALRQLLASSYRQKIELLKRAGNAG